jgi:1-deoxy-D-xylulose-5-phosphate reductoisomerase
MSAQSGRSDQSRGVTVLGSTGSIGVSTLDVLARHPDRFHIAALTGFTQVERLFEQCRRYRPSLAVLADASAARRLRTLLSQAGLDIEVAEGEEGLERAATAPSDIVMAAIVGAAGLAPTLAAVRAGKRVLIANKEPLVMCGHLFIEEAARSGAELLPIDSEHNAVFQCLPPDHRTGQRDPGVRRILLTCSGGPFRNTPQSELATVTPEQACAHPNWSMGRKISVDSATLMNKGLELIEACWLFGVAPDDVEIVIHPQSVIHSMVEYDDGSVLAQMGNPDMRTPIAHALGWPDRISSGVSPLDRLEVARLEFEGPDFSRFPALDLATQAARSGGTSPTILNAANEVAVGAFLDRQIGFLDIPRVIKAVMEAVPSSGADDLAMILDADRRARDAAFTTIETMRPDSAARGMH